MGSDEVSGGNSGEYFNTVCASCITNSRPAADTAAAAGLFGGAHAMVRSGTARFTQQVGSIVDSAQDKATAVINAANQSAAGAATAAKAKASQVREGACSMAGNKQIQVSAASAASAEEYQAINDRLNRIEKLISDLMVKVDDKTRSIEKSVAKVKSSKSKHASHKPQSVTICVDSPSASGVKDGNNCDQEQFL